MSTFVRNYGSELNTLMGKKINVQCKDSNEVFTGTLKGVNENLNLILNNAKKGNEKFHKIVISGDMVKYIVLKDTPFDVEGLAAELSKIFKSENVKMIEGVNAIRVMDRFKVTEDGVDGSGAIVERIRAIWSDFVKAN